MPSSRRSTASDAAALLSVVPRRGAAAALVLVIALLAGCRIALGATSVHAAGTPTVLPNVPVTAEDERRAPANNSPQLRVDPTDSRFVALASRVDNPDFGCALSLSGDSGRDWLPVDPVAPLPAGVDRCYAPEIVFDRMGTLWYLFIGLHGAGNSPVGAYLVSTQDRGRTFSAPRHVLGPQRYMVRMAIDTSMGAQGRLHFVWLEARSAPPAGGLPPPPNPIMTAYSDDGGATLSHPTQVSDSARPLSVAPAIAVGANGDVHIVYYDLGRDERDYQGLAGPTWKDPWSLVITTSRDRGRTFGRGVVIDAGIVPTERVILIYTMPPAAIAVDGGSDVFIAWADSRNADADVFVRRSIDAGATWMGAVRVNDDALHDGRNQYLPQLAVAADGRVDVVFYDRRNDPANRRADVYYAASTDNAATFGANVRLTAVSSDTQIGTRYLLPSAQGLVEFGSRIALAEGPTNVIAAWTDTRNSDPDTYQQDVFATTVNVGSDSSDAGRGVAIGLATAGTLLALVSGVIWVMTRRRPVAAASVVGIAIAVAASVIAAQQAPTAVTSPAGTVLPLPAHVAVTMRDNAFMVSGSAPPGRVVFDVVNRGAHEHELTFVFLPADLPPIEQQLHSPTRRVVAQIAHLHGMPPGSTGVFAAELAPGRYAMLDFLTDSNGTQYALEGVATEIRVT